MFTLILYLKPSFLQSLLVLSFKKLHQIYLFYNIIYWTINILKQFMLQSPLIISPMHSPALSLLNKNCSVQFQSLQFSFFLNQHEKYVNFPPNTIIKRKVIVSVQYICAAVMFIIFASLTLQNIFSRIYLMQIVPVHIYTIL